jgi:uncharacterized repeat protein (TIGR01451 family)
MGDDVQAVSVGSTPAQPAGLEGSEDWNRLVYSLVEVAGGGLGDDPETHDPDDTQEARDYLADLLAPGVEVEKTGPASAVPGDILEYNVEISNHGFGPALSMVLTDIAPDGSTQDFDIGTVVVEEEVTQITIFTVPDEACPGDYTDASATVNFMDIASNPLSESDSVPLEILDASAPVVSLTATPSVLWPPDHKFVVVDIRIYVEDNCDTSPVISLVSIESNEPEENFLGNGDKGPDVQDAEFGTDDRSFSLRAERATANHATGRIYTITYEATDSSGNTSVGTTTVLAPISDSQIH